MARSVWLVPEACETQVVPLVVLRITPPLPVIQAVVVLLQPTAFKVVLVPADWPVQVAPPLVVRRTAPLLPTTQTVDASAQATP